MRAPTLPLLVLVCVWLAPGLARGAQDPPSLPAPPSAEAIQTRIDALGTQDPAAPPSEDREQVLELYRQALAELELARQAARRGSDFDAQAQEAPALLESLRQELAQPPARDEPPMPVDPTLHALEQALTQADADRLSAQRTAEELQKEASRRSQRMTVLADEVAAARSAMAKVEDSLRGLGPDGALVEARRTLLLAQLETQSATVRALESERAAYDARRELLPARRDRAQRQLARADQLVEVWRARTATRRQAEAEEAAREADRQESATVARFPKLAEIVKRNAELAGLRAGEDGIPSQLDEARRSLPDAKELTAQATAKLRSTRRKVGVAGLTEAMGVLLRSEYEWLLPHVGDLRAEEAERHARMSEAQLLLITIEEERDAASDVAARHERFMRENEPGWEADAPDESRLSATAREQMEIQRELLDELHAELDQLIAVLVQNDAAHDLLASTLGTYGAFIEERILWVRSTGLVPSVDVVDGGAAIAWLLDPSEWELALQRSLHFARTHVAACTLFGLVAFALVVWRRRLGNVLIASCERARSYRTDGFKETIRGALATAAIALPGPLIVWELGWLLSAPSDQVDVARAVGLALCRVAPAFYGLELLYQAARTKRLGETHFRWSPSGNKVLRRNVRLFTPIALPLLAVAMVFDAHSRPTWGDSVGRFAFVAYLALLTVGLWRLFRPSGTILGDYFKRGSSLAERSYKVWFALTVGVPGTLVVAALTGYYYTALQFEGRFRASLGLVLGLVLVNALLLRWLFITRRRLAIEQARARAQARAESADVPEGTARESAAPLDEDKVDIPAVDAQTRKLFRSGVSLATVVGLYMIWSGAFPALRALDRVQLWPTLAIVEAADDGLLPSELEALAADPAAAEATGAAAAPSETAAGGAPVGPVLLLPSGQAEPSIAIPLEVVTLADLGLALVLLLVTIMSARNLPALLEISLLQRLPLDSGARNAVSTLARYFILMVGISAVFGAIGLSWAKIQWLAAALTFGLAFGLQEIFANFVSGIIILLERPIRVGDIVTVSDIEGRVTRLRMRATTITDFDMREILIPNKEFITGNVINWTLSDPVTRLVIPVGIAYGSDTAKARDILMKVARSNSLVLDEPGPSAIFRRFGESSLDFELRVYMESRDYWPALIDQLHAQIDLAFREADIEIAFPQRDLRVRSVEGLRDVLDSVREASATTP